MKRERPRSHVALTVTRPSERTAERMGANVRPLSAGTRTPRAPSIPWEGLESFLAVLPRVFASRAAGRPIIANGGGRATLGDDAA